MKRLLRLEPVIDTIYKLRSTMPIRRVAEAAGEELLREVLALNPANFDVRERLADRLSAQGKFQEACQLRLDGCMLVSDLMEESDDECVVLDWEDPYTAQALTMVYDSAEDHLMIGDFELATAMFEMLMDRDPEDHLNASERLAYCYVALEEWELYDETVEQFSPEGIEGRLVRYWAAFRRGDEAPEAVWQAMQRDDGALFREWTADEHAVTPEYLAAIASKRASAEVEARRLWLRTEPFWREFPEFLSGVNQWAEQRGSLG